MEYSRLTRLDPTQVAYQSHAGVAFREMHLPDRALPFLQRAVGLDPLSSNTHHNLGTVLLDLNQPECEGELALAIELDPRNANAHVNLAAVQSRVGRLAQARATLSRALQLAPEHGRGTPEPGVDPARAGGNISQRRTLPPRPLPAAAFPGHSFGLSAGAPVGWGGHGGSASRRTLEWGEKFAAPLEPGPAGGCGARDRDPDRRLRVGTCPGICAAIRWRHSSDRCWGRTIRRGRGVHLCQTASPTP